MATRGWRKMPGDYYIAAIVDARRTGLDAC